MHAGQTGRCPSVTTLSHNTPLLAFTEKDGGTRSELSFRSLLGGEWETDGGRKEEEGVHAGNVA